jgi:hypothetical protein
MAIEDNVKEIDGYIKEIYSASVDLVNGKTGFESSLVSGLDSYKKAFILIGISMSNKNSNESDKPILDSIAALNRAKQFLIEALSFVKASAYTQAAEVALRNFEKSSKTYQ